MMLRMLLVLVLMLPLPLFAQEDVPPPPPAEAPAPPPLVHEVVPLEPEAPPPALSPEEQLVERAMAFYERAQDVPPEVASLFARNPALGTTIYLIRVMSKPLIWLFLFLLVGYGGRSLLRPLFGVKPPPAQDQRTQSRAPAQAPPAAPRRVAAADLLAWLVALSIACEAVGLTWFGELWGGLLTLVAHLVSSLVWLAVLLAVASLIIWSINERGRRLVLSMLGFYYLQRSATRPPQGHLFRLPDGREATIVTTDLLHSVMQPADGGEKIMVPNADLMEQYYQWARPDAARGEGGVASPT